MNLTELLTKVMESAELSAEEMESLPHCTKVVTGNNTWERGKPLPSKPGTFIVGMFVHAMDEGHLPGDVRVYAVATEGPASFVRYTISRAYPSFTAETMNLDTFILECGEEYANLAENSGIGGEEEGGSEEEELSSPNLKLVTPGPVGPISPHVEGVTP